MAAIHRCPDCQVLLGRYPNCTHGWTTEPLYSPPIERRTLVRLPVQAGSVEAFEGRRFSDRIAER